MSTHRTLIAAIRWLFGILVVAVFVVAAGMLVPRPLFPVPGASVPGAGVQRILLLSNPIHTDIAIPLDAQTRARFAFLEDSGLPLSHPAARWLIVGWGGRAFYTQTPTWADLKPLPLIKGLTLDAAVMHVEVTGDLVEPQPSIIAYTVDAQHYDRLLSFIAASFAPDVNGILAIPGFAYGDNDRFFEATGWFNALVGCNTWTAQALRAAGLRTGWWNPLPVTLRVSLGLFNT